MIFESRVIGEFIQDYSDLASDLKRIKKYNETRPLLKEEKMLKAICKKLTQSCYFEEKIFHEYMRSRVEDEFQLMVIVNEKYHENISSIVEVLKKQNYQSEPSSLELQQLVNEVEEHFLMADKQIFSCLYYYLNNELDRKLLSKYLTELCKKSIADSRS